MFCCGSAYLILSMYYVFFLFSVFVPAVVPPLTHYLSSRWYIIFQQPPSGELIFTGKRASLFLYWYCTLIFTFTRLNVQNMVYSKLVEL